MGGSCGTWGHGDRGRWGQGEMGMESGGDGVRGDGDGVRDGVGGDGPVLVVGEWARPSAPQCCSCAHSPTDISELGAAAHCHAVPKAIPCFWELGEVQAE